MRETKKEGGGRNLLGGTKPPYRRISSQAAKKKRRPEKRWGRTSRLMRVDERRDKNGKKSKESKTFHYHLFEEEEPRAEEKGTSAETQHGNSHQVEVIYLINWGIVRKGKIKKTSTEIGARRQAN